MNRHELLTNSFPPKQAKVEWPADMPDDMLEDAIAISKKTLDEHDFEADGVEVSTNKMAPAYCCIFEIDC